MIGWLGSGGMVLKQGKGRSRGRWRAAAVLGVLAVPLAAAGAAAVPAAAATTYAVTAAINVDSRPAGVGVDPSTHTVYVANGNGVVNGNTMSVIDGATNTVTATIAVGSDPVSVGVDPSTQTAYVTNELSSSVSVIDEATNTVTATIAVGSDPVGVGVDPSTQTVYVTDQGSKSVSVINEATDTVTATIGLPAAPSRLGVDPSTDTVYVGNGNNDSVWVIDGATNTVTATIGLRGDPTAVGIDPSTDTVYVTGEGNSSVWVIDGATNTVTATISVGAGPFGVGVDPSTHVVYVASNDSGIVSVITPVSDADLSLATPGSITTDATGPSGATVSYALPQVSDPDDASVPAASCTPAPGSVFAIRTTTVHCSASDPHDSKSPVTVSFTVTVKGAAAQLHNLHQAVQGVGPGTSLSDKVTQAQSYLGSGDVSDTCSTLETFIHEVAAQSGKHIPAATASVLITDANRIQAVLAC